MKAQHSYQVCRLLHTACQLFGGVPLPILLDLTVSPVGNSNDTQVYKFYAGPINSDNIIVKSQVIPILEVNKVHKNVYANPNAAS